MRLRRANEPAPHAQGRYLASLKADARSPTHRRGSLYSGGIPASKLRSFDSEHGSRNVSFDAASPNDSQDDFWRNSSTGSSSREQAQGSRGKSMSYDAPFSAMRSGRENFGDREQGWKSTTMDDMGVNPLKFPKSRLGVLQEQGRRGGNKSSVAGGGGLSGGASAASDDKGGSGTGRGRKTASFDGGLGGDDGSWRTSSPGVVSGAYEAAELAKQMRRKEQIELVSGA